MKKYNKITERERDRIARWKAQKVSNKECARRLGRSASTIGRELKRNHWKCETYVAIYAQGLANKRERKSAHGKKPLKNAKIYAYVTKHLRGGWSPDQISGRLKRKHRNDNSWWITAETIYRWIYSQEKNEFGLYWYEYLRRKQKKRKKQTGRKVHRSHIPDRVSIKDRPEEVNQRQMFAHWEGDSIEGLRSKKDGIHTEVERISRLIAGTKVSSLTGKETVRAQKKIFGQYPKGARKSTTLDNGRENHDHIEMEGSLKMQTYFADPYSSWQRGTNEHGNWHLRYYFPKKTDFTEVSEEELQDAIQEINNRPRKILGYQTAQEVFTTELQKLSRKGQGVAVAN